MEMKAKLLEEMNQPKYQAKSTQDWEVFFNIQSKEDFTELVKILTELEDEYLVVRSKNDRYLLASQMGYYKGVVSVNRKGFGFVDFVEMDSIFIPKSKLNGAMDQDTVIVHKLNKHGKDEGEVIKVVERKTNTMVGIVYCKRKPIKFIPDDERIKENIIILNPDEFPLVHGQKVQVTIAEFGSSLKCNITRILGHENDPGVDVLSILLEHDIEPEFPSEVMDEIKTIPQKVLEEDKVGRVDLRDKLIVTIDGDDAKDLDDAISLEKIENGYRLGVHIADVSHYVKEGSPLDQEAFLRGTSTYVVDRVVPMLPHALSNGVCSLNPKVERLTLTCMMDIDETGNIVNYQIFPSFIQTIERMTYHNVNMILAKDKKMMQRYEHLGNLFFDMKYVADCIRSKREELGAIDFEKDESYIKVNKDGKVIDIYPRVRGRAEMIIEDFMVLANECVARHTKWLELPSLYRIHEKPQAKKIREFAKIALLMGHRFKGGVEDLHPKTLQTLLAQAKGSEEYPILSLWLLRSMQKAKYDSACLGHFGLGLEEYTHFTSPIRRYPDLIVHRMLRKYCFDSVTDVQEIQNDEIKMQEIATQSSIRERKATDAEREVEDMKKAEFMEDHIGETFEGVISGVANFGFFVQLPNTVEGLVRVESLEDDYYEYVPEQMSMIGKRSNRIYKIGQKVKIKVEDANKRQQTIDFVLVKDKRPNKKRHYKR